MKLLASLFLLPILLIPVFGQTDRVELVNDKPGRAEAKVAGVVLHADDATLDHETGELHMHGHVHATLPAREDHTVIRYGAGVLLTDQPIGLTADRVTVRNGLVVASGNIVVVPVDPELPKVQLRGDELSMQLKVATLPCEEGFAPAALLSRRVIHAPCFRLGTCFRPTS